MRSGSSPLRDLYAIGNTEQMRTPLMASTQQIFSDNNFSLLAAEIREYAIFMVDPEGFILSWNKGAEQIKGYAADEIIGQHLSILYTATDIAQNLPARNLERAALEGHYESEDWRLRKDGTMFLATINLTTFYDEFLQVKGFIKITRDITLQKATETSARRMQDEIEQLTREKLESSLKETADYRYALDSSSIVAIADQKGVIKFANENFCVISKYPAVELIGLDYRIICASCHPASFLRDLQVTIAKGKVWRGEIENKARDGRIYWAHTTIVPFLDSTGKPYQYVAIGNDITARKNAEEKLETERHQYARLFDEAPSAFGILKGPDHIFIKTNPLCIKLVGGKDVIGLPIRTALPELARQGFCKLLDDVYNTGESFYGTDMLVKIDSGDGITTTDMYVDFLYQACRSSKGQIEGIFFFANEVTGKVRAVQTIEKSEKRFRAIIENNFDAILVWNKEGRITYQSPAVERMTGYTLDETSSAKLAFFLHPDDIVTTATGGRQASEYPGTPVFVGCRVRHKEGHYIWVEGSVINLLEDMDIQGIVGNFRDVTARKRIEEALQLLNDDLENRVAARTQQFEVANRSLDAFSYSISHDLRAPLRGIIGFSNILQEDYGTLIDNEGNRLLKKVVANATNMSQLIDDLLAFARLGRREISVHPIDMQQLADNCINELLHDRDLTDCKVECGKIPSCTGDLSMIRQVWLNVIGNGIKYAAKNRACHVTIGSDDNETMHVYFVKDNGIGFDMQYAHNLFGVFQRLHSKEEFEGTGVGLSLVKLIINKHHGEVWAEGEPGKGATFYFSLPK